MHARTRSLNRPLRYAILAMLAFGALFASPLLRAAQCSISTSGLSFGVYDPLAGYPSTAPVTANGALQLACSYTSIGDLLVGIQAQISLSTGSSGSYAARTLRQGAESLRYNLYVDPALTTVFGDGSGGTQRVAKCFTGFFNNCGGDPANSPVSIPVYGALPGSQDVSPGGYADNIVVTVTF
ncbi:pilus protein [Mizugakiibacter sediminis]|uniref:Pilus assembly protein n=1 Tax=Mizugakiibacter sediminis TaxID=1475481 RepID=A0A0K8QP80_9GAMM|nr:pilus protein [Mizugakiibacter sediminis]